MSILRAIPVVALMSVAAAPAMATVITFAPGDYDNTANTVTGNPITTHNNQTTGLFRDEFWWRINNGQPNPGSPDFINAGKTLWTVPPNGISAVQNPNSPYTTLNFTGPSISGGQTYLTIYDQTPGDGAATKSLFNFGPTHQTISADFLFVKHNSSAGLVAFYTPGQDGLALLANNRDGNNTDRAKVSLVFDDNGTGIELTSATLDAATFLRQEWYRVSMELWTVGDTWNVIGKFYDHVDGTNPNSALDTLLATLTWSGSLSNPDASNRILSNPGEIGIVAMGNESISLPDNVGVSVTNFTFYQDVPEPASMLVFGIGLAGLGWAARRRTA